MAENNKGKGKNGDESRKEYEVMDICFNCKDGGLLLLCDHKKCNKAYHPKCVGKDNKFIKSKRRWLCDLHFCSGCLQCISDSDIACQMKKRQKRMNKGTKGDPSIICQNSSSEDAMGPTNIDEIGLERDESSAAKETEVRKGIEYDIPDEQSGAILKSLPYGSHVAGTEQTQPSAAGRKLELVDPANSLWYCIVSGGTVKGPCPLSFLRTYADFDPVFLKQKVWIAGQRKETAIALGDALKLDF